ncbi:unnamed protein product [Thlaspi arvense]|uniref:F-box/LRR-repeat protein 15/At3g58940/PEG3-like LRR domain-containing protein n=1 Tax=Thlaspi arvense TaxID=13288 RepID=A0AAU9T9E3_THLAR|nr:unnamed protein product [Thlaspi arvense]
MGSISAASGTTVLSSNLRRHNNQRSGLYDRRHENLSVVSSSQPFLMPRQRWLNVTETRLRREILRMNFVAGAADSTSSSPSVASGDKTLIPDEEFTLAKISFGVIGLSLGVSLLSYGFGAYFNILPGSEWSAIMLTYGFPLAIIGMALKYAELRPVPCLSYSDAVKLRESCATPILTQVRSDVTRYRYGDEQHLEEALKRIFQYGLGGGIPRRSAPILTMIREEVLTDGRYCLVLVFEAKALKLSDFEQRQAKFTSFFGPNITAEVGGRDLKKGISLMDWISELPHTLLLRVMSLLPSAKGVVVKMVLSKRWKFLWMYLLLHEAPVIESLHFKLCEISGAEDIRVWIRAASKCSVRELIFEFDSSFSESPSVVPRILYTGCTMLVTLKLNNVVLSHVSSPVSFPILKTLSLLSVVYPHEQFVYSLLSHCHVLEDLKTERSQYDNVSVFTVRVPSLKRVGFCVIENEMPNIVEANVDVTYPHPDEFLSCITSVKRLFMCLSTSKDLYPVGTVFKRLVHLTLCTCNKEWLNILMSILRDS